MTTKKSKPVEAKPDPCTATERDLMTLLVMLGFGPQEIVNLSKPGDPIIMEWTFVDEAAPFVLQWERQGKKSFSMDGFTYADVVEAQSVFRSCLQSVNRSQR